MITGKNNRLLFMKAASLKYRPLMGMNAWHSAPPEKLAGVKALF